MPSTTTNYNLKKPIASEYFNVEDQNGNMDLIDAVLTPTADPAQVPAANTGKLGQWVSWLTNRIKAITGGTNWYDAPAITLKDAANQISGEAITRANADTTLQNNITAEASARSAADTALQAVATQDKNGLMSSADKIRMDALYSTPLPISMGGTGQITAAGALTALGIGCGTCVTTADTAAKVVTLPGFSLTVGGIIAAKFTYANTVASATLNVNGTGAKSIYVSGSAISAFSQISAGMLALFQYDGTYWQLLNPAYPSGVVPVTNGGTGATSALTALLALGNGYGTCATAAATAAKVVSMSGFTLVVGGIIGVSFTYINTAVSPTLNVNGMGAKPIYYAGVAATSATPIPQKAFFQYDGANWNLINEPLSSANQTLIGVADMNSALAKMFNESRLNNLTLFKINTADATSGAAQAGYNISITGTIVAPLTTQYVTDSSGAIYLLLPYGSYTLKFLDSIIGYNTSDIVFSSTAASKYVEVGPIFVRPSTTQYEMTTSKTYLKASYITTADLWLCGGGGAGGSGNGSVNALHSSGGGGGYTKTILALNVSSYSQFTSTIGAGGGVGSMSNGGTGGTTSILTYSANGGAGGACGLQSTGTSQAGGAGGSGGGGSSVYGYSTNNGVNGGIGGTDGGAGGSGGVYNGYNGGAGGSGQGTTTRLFDEASNTLYCGGGGGSRLGAGGTGGGGTGANGNSGSDGSSYGAGGGGGGRDLGGKGYQGVVIIRWTN